VNCPLIWCSKLQTKIALSTAEAEYIAMSHALQGTVSVQNLVKEVSCMFLLPDPITDFCFTVHEDNHSALSMAVIKIHSSHQTHCNKVSSLLQ
jgi:hypothetical protein